MEAVLKKIIFIILMVSLSYNSLAGTSHPRFSKELMADYLQRLVTKGCDGAVNGYPQDEIVADAAQGMNKKLESYAYVHNLVVLGNRIGEWLQTNNWKTMKNGVKVLNCEELGNHIAHEFSKQDDGFETFLSEPKQAEIALKNSFIYQTNAKALARLYGENEIAADDKIGNRKVEVSGTIKNIRKDFKDDVVIELDTGNQFMPARLRMDDEERSKAAKLKKGQKTTITCEKMKLLIGSPSGSSCVIN